MRILAMLTALLLALAGCTSEPELDSEPDDVQTPDPEPEPDPPEPVRTVLEDDTLTVARGAPAGANCQRAPPGVIVDGGTGTNTNQGQDYDGMDVAEEHWGLNATFTVESSGEVWVLFLNDDSPVDGYHWRLTNGEVQETEVPANSNGVGFTSCNEAGASVVVEFWDTTFE